MPRFAIVIGIDAYANEDWNLSAAVNDALRFAQWALGPGGVEPENLRLLLSPAQAGVTALPCQAANRRNIRRTILDFQQGAGQGGDRLYFYYAGHGVSAPGATAGGPLEPVLIPCDVESLQTDADLLLGFSDIMPLFTDVEPVEQFFFIDACREFALEGFQRPIGQSVGRWVRPHPEAGPRSAQYVLYATAPGLRAYEHEHIKGRGVFASALLDGLSGTPAALAWSPAHECYQVRFSTLVRHVRSRIEREIQQRGPRDWRNYVQIPESETQGGTPDPVLATVAPEAVGRLAVRVRVGPSQARPMCQVRVQQYLQGGQRAVDVVDPQGPPAPLPARFDLLPGDYSFLAQAERYAPAREPCPVYEARSVRLELQPAPERAPEPPEPKAPGGGTLEVISYDQSVFIVVRDAERQIAGSGMGYVRLQPLSPGIYRVQFLLPEGPVRERVVEVLAGDRHSVTLDDLAPQMGRDQMRMLGALQISADEAGYLHPSEHLGGIANARLASLLGFAALAAQWPPGDFYRLKNFGIERMAGVPPGGSGVLVLLGASGDRPAPGVAPARFLAGGRLVARDLRGRVIDEGGFETLSGFSAAAERRAQLEPGPVDLELHLPGSAPTHYALACLPDRVTVLVVVAEDSGAFEVQQYLLPLRYQAARVQDSLAERPSNIRRIEVAQRYYASERQIPLRELDDLLYGKWLDPLLGCLAGYSLVRAGRQDQFVGQPEPYAGHDEPEPSAMRNMLKFFDGLPDSHVLAGLCEPERQREHYAHALERGLPVFAEGFRALYGWYGEEGAGPPPALAGPGTGLLPASPWTAWTLSPNRLRKSPGRRSQTGSGRVSDRRPPVGRPSETSEV